MDAVIFDIDGTLADLTHRRGFVTGGNKDWKSFFESMSADTPTEVAFLADLVGAAKFFDDRYAGESPFAIFICSGRPEEYREVTETWLTEHVPGLFHNAEALLMRPTGDYRPDTEIKREMLAGIRGQGFEPRIVVDDRPTVIQMWKDEGLTVLEVDSGEWDAKPTVKSGTLWMMVGPSGAGKSTYVSSNFIPSTIISTDDLRIQLTGDMANQSMNEQVFMAAHALTRTRLACGLDVVFDATNLHARDRLAVRNQALADTPIIYIVIDRPLAEKHETAGWRDNVVIKGVKLVDKHHQSFHSGLKHILDGDGDPRVTVRNLIRK